MIHRWTAMATRNATHNTNTATTSHQYAAVMRGAFSVSQFWFIGVLGFAAVIEKLTMPAMRIAERTRNVHRVLKALSRPKSTSRTVPMTMSVESPMTEQSYVTEVMVVGDGNPNGGMATFHFTPLSGAAEANTRIRLAATQNITAVAKMSDGSFYTASKQVKVTIGGCGG